VGFTLREVARRAGVSHNAPYRHFKDRDDLMATVATQGFRELNNRPCCVRPACIRGSRPP